MLLRKTIGRIINIIRIILINRKYNCDISLKSIVDKTTSFEGNNIVQYDVNLNKCKIGLATYISPKCSFIKTKIGRYCSIAPNVKIIAGNHPTNTYISTHPIFYTNNDFVGLKFSDENLFEEYTYVDKEKKWLCNIGNDVWIGEDVRIINGINIGDGVIIATGAVVTKDIAPYSIVAGIPAKIVKRRFSEEQIEVLNEFKWWDKSTEWIKEASQNFRSLDIFIKNIKEVKK